jgi:mitochondrial fission protein ELM1
LSADKSGPSIWCVADGRAGIVNQTLALKAALDEPDRAARLANVRSAAHRDTPLILQPQGWQLWLRPDLWPAPMAALPAEQRDLLKAPWPDVWIAAGRRSIPYSRLVKKLSGGATLVVQTQNPKVSLDSFDLVIPPEHDGVSGANVFPILGPPVWFSRQRVKDAHDRFANLKSAPGQKVLVSIGGDSKNHRMSEANIASIEGAIQRLAEGRTFWITVSRRTPEQARVRFRRLASTLPNAVFWENEERDGPNPYVAFLSMCDVALVTCESANMIADPAFFGKPVYLMKLDGGSPRFDKLHQGFIGQGAARWFTGALQTWTYDPIREAARAADEIVRRVLERRSPPQT